MQAMSCLVRENERVCGACVHVCMFVSVHMCVAISWHLWNHVDKAVWV
jgi:hypothetical protein